MNIEIGKSYLISCDNHFYAPDGLEYKAVFGTVKAVCTAEDTLGIRPNGRSTNWYVEIGNMIVAGCQIHYVARTDCCHFEDAPIVLAHEGVYHTSMLRSYIYNADWVIK